MNELFFCIREMLHKNMTLGEVADALKKQGYSKMEIDKAINQYINQTVKGTDINEYI